MRLTKKALVSSFSPPLFIEEVSEERRSLYIVYVVKIIVTATYYLNFVFTFHFPL